MVESEISITTTIEKNKLVVHFSKDLKSLNWTLDPDDARRLNNVLKHAKANASGCFIDYTQDDDRTLLASIVLVVSKFEDDYFVTIDFEDGEFTQLEGYIDEKVLITLSSAISEYTS